MIFFKVGQLKNNDKLPRPRSENFNEARIFPLKTCTERLKSITLLLYIEFSHATCDRISRVFPLLPLRAQYKHASCITQSFQILLLSPQIINKAKSGLLGSRAFFVTVIFDREDLCVVINKNRRKRVACTVIYKEKKAKRDSYFDAT